MGGDLILAADERSKSASPRFILLANKDPLGANLDRVQIIKGWVNGEGDSSEKIFDVAASDGRLPDPATHRVSPLESTVNAREASYQNSIGAAVLRTVWTDPEFNANEEAFYYARVVEIPTPTTQTHDAKTLGVAPPVEASHQERAITSAIGYRLGRDRR